MAQASAIFALNFLAPWTWWFWLAAASLPILIHLWNRRRYRETQWAAMQWLLAAVRRKARRVRIEQLLLLAVRVAIIVLLIAAMAEPYIDRVGRQFVAGERTHHVLVIDSSFSMGYERSGKTYFEIAKGRARQIVDASGPGDAFTLVLMRDLGGSRDEDEIRQPSGYKDDVRRVIDSLELTHTTADLPAALGRVSEVITAAAESDPGLKQTAVYFITDLAASTWLPYREENEQARKIFQDRANDLARRAGSVQVIDVSSGEHDNLAITGLRPDGPLVTVGRKVKFVAEVRNYGRRTLSSVSVAWYVDGRRFGASAARDLPPGGTPQQAEFTIPFDQPGDHTVEARLEGADADPLDVDNHRWYALTVKPALEVLLVEGKPATAGSVGSAHYLELAVTPGERVPNRVRVEPNVIPDGLLVEHDLAPYDCIFFANVGQFNAEEARLIDRFLRSGRGVVFFLGDRVRPESYNRYLGGEGAEDLRVLPARIGNVVSEARYTFDPLDYEHPLARIFQGQEQAGLLNTPVYRYFRLEVPEAWSSRVALAFDGGDPAVVEGTVQRGRSLLVATAGSTASRDDEGELWTPLARSPAFVPIVQELLALAVQNRSEERNVEVGKPLAATLDTVAGSTTVEVLLPASASGAGGEMAREDDTASGAARGDDSRIRTVSLVPQDGLSAWSFDDARQSGIYRVRYPELSRPGETYAVNFATVPEAARSESDLTPLTADELHETVSPLFEHHSSPQRVGETTEIDVTRRSGLYPWFLYAVLGLLLAETYLGYRFAHQGP